MLSECNLIFHYSDSDESSLSSAEQYLSGKELLALRDILREDVIDSLQHKGLDLNAIENVQITLEEVQQLLHSLEQHEIATTLRRLIDFCKLMDFCYNKLLNVHTCRITNWSTLKNESNLEWHN